MSRSTLKRLESLEQKFTRLDGKMHIVFGHDDEELDRNEQALKASRECKEGDSLISVRWVAPGEAVDPKGLSA
jgi:hypothetical protein